MNAKEFIKKFGWEEAKSRTKPNMIDMWDAGWGFYTRELKEYIDAYELVQKHNGIINAKDDLCIARKFSMVKVFGTNLNQLEQAISLIEEI